MDRKEFRAVQRQFIRSLRERPLDLSDEDDRRLYQPLHDDAHDPVRRLFDTIDLGVEATVQLVPGFRGTGKTTEFSRLEKLLWESGHMVVRVDLDEHLGMSSPVNIIDFLLALTGAVNERLVDDRLLGAGDSLHKSFIDRLRRVISLDPQVAQVTAKVPGFLDVRMDLRGDETLRDQLRQALGGKLPALVKELRGYHEELRARLRKRHGCDPQLVIIVDSLEHIHGSDERAESVHRSVEELFFTHGRHLLIPETHLVMSVPAFLALRADNLAAEFGNGAVQVWSTCRVRDAAGEPVREAIDRMVALVERRCDWRLILPDRDALVRVILASGGYLRDLLNMLIEATHLAGRGRLPTPEEIIAVARRAYLPLYADEIAVLRRIAAERSLGAVTTDERDHVLRFLDSHLVLCYLNDRFWYDVHPLVRDEVLGP